MKALAVLVKIKLTVFLCTIGLILLIYINTPGHNYEKNLNIKSHFAYFYSERVLAKHLNV